MERRGVRVLDWLWFLLCGVASSVWCVTASGQLGATFDEPIYIARGLERWRTGSHQGLMQLGTMPLPVDLDTLPLYLWERWHGICLDPVEDLPELLPWARAGTLVFWWILLWYGRLAGRDLAGPWGGRLAVALLACEPSLLAHASLATTDIAVSACLLALVYHFRRAREARWLWRVGIPACWFGAAILAKASGLVFGPLCLLVVELERRIREQRTENREQRTEDRERKAEASTQYSVLSTQYSARSLVSGLRSLFSVLCSLFSACWRDLVQIGLLGLLLVFVYCGSDWHPQRSFVDWSRQLPEGSAREVMVWLADHLCIFSNAGEGLVRQIRHNLRGHGVYLLGHADPRSIWYYFPIALTIKLSLALLLLPLLVALLRPQCLLNWSCLSAAALLLFSLTCRVQIGIRLILPLVVLAIIGLAGAAVTALQKTRRPGDQSPLLVSLSPCLLVFGFLWTTGSALAVWPHGLCYTNELWGGTARGYLRLSDSNYDWGQGLKELDRWQRAHGVDLLEVWYFGTDPILKRLPLREVPLHSLPLQTPQDVTSQVRGRYLAVSTTLLFGMMTDTPGHEWACAFLRSRRPVDRTMTFLIYDLGKK
jgi:hypothetical protein